MTSCHCTWLVALVLLLLGSSRSAAEQFQACAWNVESGGIVRSVIGAQLRDFEGVHLWALSEVQVNNADFFIASAGEGENGEFSGVIGSTGGADRLVIVLDESKFEFIEGFEFEDLALGGGRAPLVVHLRTRSDGTEFFFVAVHLHRGNAEKRLLQARELRNWAETEPLPIVIAGDFNFDFDVPNGPGNEAFDEFGLGGSFEWERPHELVSTQYSDHNSDGEPDFNSVLDFFWTSGAAQRWGIRTEILVRPGDFPDDNSTSDHRPVLATIDTAAVQPMAAGDKPKLRIAQSRVMASVRRHGRAEDWPGAEAGAAAASESETSVLGMGPASFGRFVGRVAATWDNDGRGMSLLEDFHYLDAHGKEWTAPKGAQVNGASIPKAFWSVIGGPFEGRYRNASVVHDVYCDTQERPWRDVHRMFYEACRCGGASAAKSKLMYYAVYHFGPRWGGPTTMAAAEALRDDEVAALSAYIAFRDPSLDELEDLPPSAFGRDD